MDPFNGGGSEFEPGNSIEVVIWTAVGGRGTIVGPIVGALLVNAGKSWFTGVLPELWLFALGALFIATTLFLPKGIVGTWDMWRNSRKAKAAAATPDDSGPHVPQEADDVSVSASRRQPPLAGAEPQPAE